MPRRRSLLEEEAWREILEAFAEEEVRPVGVLLLLYFAARKLGAVPHFLIPYLDSMVGVLVVATIPLLFRYMWPVPWISGVVGGILDSIRRRLTGLRRRARKRAGVRAKSTPGT